MSITSVTAVPAIRAAIPAQAPAQQPDSAPARLAPAVRIDIRQGDTAQPGDAARSEDKTSSETASAANVQRHNRIDPDTKTLVYQEVDQASGDIVVQIPDAVVLKARAYVEAQAARNQKAERPVDRTA